MDQRAIVACFAESDEQFRHLLLLAESIRTFAGTLSDCPIAVYVPKTLQDIVSQYGNEVSSRRMDVRTSAAPEDAMWYYFAEKVFAASQAEEDFAGQCDILVWMDEDSLVLQEPAAFNLAPETTFAYRPVMHNRSGSLYGQPPDPFWSQIYNRLEITEEKLFPMVTPADEQTIRAYFNAGLLVVRPSAQVLRRWDHCFKRLYTDTTLDQMCHEDQTCRIFLHQTALVGAVLNHLPPALLQELPASYNYPLFFHEQFGATRAFDRLDNIHTLRYDTYFRDPAPDWRDRLKGPPRLVDWLAARLGK